MRCGGRGSGDTGLRGADSVRIGGAVWVRGTAAGRLLGWYGRLVFFFFNDTATTEIYTLSLHDALPI